MKLQTLGLMQPDRTETRNNPLNNPAMPLSEVAQWEFLGGGSDTEAAEVVNTNTALQLSTVFSCVKILAESVSSLPLQFYSKTATGRILETDNPLSYMLGAEPNREMDYPSWMEDCMSHLALTGNSYCQIQRDAADNPVALWPLSPRLTCPYRLANNTLVYKTEDGGVQRYLAAKDVLHVKTISFDGLLGMSPIMQAKRLMGAQIASEKYGSRFFANNSTPAAVLTTKMKVRSEDKPRMRADWESQLSGANQRRIGILDQDMDIKVLGISNDEAQFLEMMQFNRAQIGAIYRISSHLLGSETRQTDANVESMNTSFLTQTLSPYLVKFESEIAKKILPRNPGQHSKYSVSFDTSAMLRGDSAAKAAWYSASVNNGWMTRNDVRRSEGMNEGGPELDVYTVQGANINATRLLADPNAPEQVINEK